MTQSLYSRYISDLYSDFTLGTVVGLALGPDVGCGRRESVMFHSIISITGLMCSSAFPTSGASRRAPQPGPTPSTILRAKPDAATAGSASGSPARYHRPNVSAYLEYPPRACRRALPISVYIRLPTAPRV